MSGDSAFTGSIPETYENALVPVLFAPYAHDLAARVGALGASEILEIAAGTGAVTRELAATLGHGAHLVATDLNQEMLDVAARRVGRSDIEYRVADAQDLPFDAGRFDCVACQFGVMFYPDRPRAHAEAHRVLQPGGSYLFSVWNRLDENPASLAVHNAAVELAEGPPPDFIARVPFGYHDKDRIRADLAEAGFADASIERVDFEQPDELLPGLIEGMCRGSPLALSLADQSDEVRQAIEIRSREEVKRIARHGPVAMSALVVEARRN